VACTIRQRFLHDAVNAGLMLVRQPGDLAIQLEVYRNAAALGELAGLPLERRAQTQFIQH
jgi:hypothetical protein